MSEGGESAEMATELILEKISDDNSEKATNRWHKQVAFSTLIMAMLAAVSGLFSGLTSHESLVDRTEQVMAVSMLEGDRLSVVMLKAKHQILLKLGEPLDEAEVEEIRSYEEQMRDDRAEVRNDQLKAIEASHAHIVFALAVMMLAVGISLSGMSVVLDQRWLWLVGLVSGAGGAICFVIGVLTMVI